MHMTLRFTRGAALAADIENLRIQANEAKTIDMMIRHRCKITLINVTLWDCGTPTFGPDACEAS